MRLSALILFALFPSLICAQNDLEGSWDCQLKCPGGPLRFKIEIESSLDSDINASVRNGSERIEIPIVIASEKKVVFEFDHYDSKISCERSVDRLKGTWKKRRGSDKWVEMEFEAAKQNKANSSHSNKSGELAKLFDGKWKVQFSKSDDPAVGIFKSSVDKKMDGTFLTTTGDYRYLHGSIMGKKMELSCFDGAHAFLFRAAVEQDKMTGDFWSSDTWHESWTAVRDPNAELADAFSQTVLVADHPLNTFAFPDLDGNKTRLDDPKFNADAKLIYVFGSWCPNCHDAAAYFKQLQQKYGDSLSIVGLAFEHTGSFERDAEQVRKYLKRHAVNYPVLVAGLSDKKLASESIPFLDKVRSYPTTIFLNSNNEVQAIHTGFTGPATGEAYQKMKVKFETIIGTLAGKK